MEEKTLLLTLKARAACTEDVVASYLATFNSDGILRLFENDSDKSKYLERYSAFAIRFTDVLSLLEASVGDLSAKILEYESLKIYDKAEALCSVFESCEEFFSASARFIEENETNFKHKTEANPVHALASARVLRQATEDFVKRING